MSSATPKVLASAILTLGHVASSLHVIDECVICRISLHRLLFRLIPLCLHLQYMYNAYTVYNAYSINAIIPNGKA